MEPPALFVTLPLPKNKAPAPNGAVTLPLLLSVPDPWKPTPPVIDAPALFVTVPLASFT